MLITICKHNDIQLSPLTPTIVHVGTTLQHQRKAEHDFGGEGGVDAAQTTPAQDLVYHIQYIHPLYQHNRSKTFTLTLGMYISLMTEDDTICKSCEQTIGHPHLNGGPKKYFIRF